MYEALPKLSFSNQINFKFYSILKIKPYFIILLYFYKHLLTSQIQDYEIKNDICINFNVNDIKYWMQATRRKSYS